MTASSDWNGPHDGVRIPLLAIGATTVDGEVVGRTILTRAAPETTDDEGASTISFSRFGNQVPFLAESARDADEYIIGGTRITMTRETTDD